MLKQQAEDMPGVYAHWITQTKTQLRAVFPAHASTKLC